jgi:hypothetical protein
VLRQLTSQCHSSQVMIDRTAWRVGSCSTAPWSCAKPGSHWPRSRVEQSKFRSDNFEAHKSSDNFRPAPTSSLLYQPKPQICLTEKSRSRAPPATPCSPRRSPRRLAASSCSTRHVYRESRHAHYSDILQWSYEEVEVRDISLTYVHPSIPSRALEEGTMVALGIWKCAARTWANRLAATTSRSARLSTSHILPAAMPLSDSGRRSALSLSVSPTRS